MLKRPLLLVAAFLLLMALVSQVYCNARAAKEGQFPWAVALFHNGEFICTASVISPTDVLTAAHCVVIKGEVPPANAYHGIANVSKSAPQYRIEFSSLTPHPDYDTTGETMKNDLAVLKMSYRLETGVNHVTPICIAAPESDDYKDAVAMGWGRTMRSDPNSYPDILHYKNQKIVDNSKCSQIYPEINENNLCARGSFTGLCNGDGGGPLVHFGNNTPPVQIGIASFLRTFTGCPSIYPTVFTRVSAYNAFILENTEVCICTRLICA